MSAHHGPHMSLLSFSCLNSLLVILMACIGNGDPPFINPFSPSLWSLCCSSEGCLLTTDRIGKCLDTWSFIESLTHRMVWIGSLLKDYLVPVPLSWKPMEGFPPAISQKERLQKQKSLPFPPLTLSCIEPSLKNREQATSTSMHALV